MVETQSIIARQSDESTNFVVYEAPEPDVPTDDFVQALSGMYVNKAVFEQQDIEAPEIIEVTVDDEQALTLQPDSVSNNTRSFNSAHELDGRDVICSMYLAHRLYEQEQVPEELSVSIDMSASLADWEDAEEAVEEEFGTVETDDVEEEVGGFIFGEDRENDSDEDESSDETEASEESKESTEDDSEDGLDTSEAEEELAEMVES